MKTFPLVYIVDDDPIFVFVMRKLLQKTGRFDQVEVLHNGFDAIESLRKRADRNQPLPDLIFLDLNMPVLDGWQFLDEVDQLPFHDRLVIHIISSSVDIREINKAKAYRTVRSFVSKPVTMEWLEHL